jgi:hypothetical protein
VRDSVLIFINLKFSPQFHWFWFSAMAGVWFNDACATSFLGITQLGTKNKKKY